QLEAGVATVLSQLGATVTVRADGSFTYDPTTSVQLSQFASLHQDVIDSFDYSVLDPHAPGYVGGPGGGTGCTRGTGGGSGGSGSGSGTGHGHVSIMVLSDPSAYHFDVVASQSDGFDKLGWGPSINNRGFVGFQGTNNANRDSVYIWNKDFGFKSLVSPAMLQGGPFGLPEHTLDAPGALFGPAVQVHDPHFLIPPPQTD